MLSLLLPVFSSFPAAQPSAGHRRGLFARIRPRTAAHTAGPVSDFNWPTDLTLETIGDAIASTYGIEIIVRPIPAEMRHHEISGLTTMTGRIAHVFYDADLSPLNREQTILHEFAHIFHKDVSADSDCTHLRSMFDDPVETRAETTGMQLLDMLHRSRRESLGKDSSEALAFFTGIDDSGVRP